MTMPDNPALPEAVAVATENVDWSAGIETIAPLADALIKASRECDLPDINAIFHALPPVPADIADEAEAAVESAYDAAISALPIMRTFVRSQPVKLLRGLVELSFAAGRAGDDAEAWHDEMNEALVDGFGFENTPEGPHRSSQDHSATAINALERAFKAGCAQREIDQATGPSRPLTVAKAYALIYRDEAECAADLAACWVGSAVARTAFRVASRHAVTAAEAALVAIEAFRAEGMPVPLTVAAEALDRARVGVEERRSAEEDAKAREAAAADQLAALFANLADADA